MEIKARYDAFGNPENVTSAELRHILDLIDGYMKGEPYYIREIWRDDIKDPNGRIDVEIQFTNDQGYGIERKLLILKDEVIDGKTFHARYDEWYPKKNMKDTPANENASANGTTGPKGITEEAKKSDPEILYYELCFYHDEDDDMADPEKRCCYCIKTEINLFSEKAQALFNGKAPSDIALYILFGSKPSEEEKELIDNCTSIFQISEDEALSNFDVHDLTCRITHEIGVYYVREDHPNIDHLKKFKNLATLPDGTFFEVNWGSWCGYITTEDGKKVCYAGANPKAPTKEYVRRFIVGEYDVLNVDILREGPVC